MRKYTFTTEQVNKLNDFVSMSKTLTKAKEEFPDADVSLLEGARENLAVEIVEEITKIVGFGTIDNDFLYMLKEQYDRPE